MYLFCYFVDLFLGQVNQTDYTLSVLCGHKHNLFIRFY